jgi:RNA polymerase sigma factor (sigma-70 family)
VELRENWPTVRFPIAYARARACAAVFAALRDEERRGYPRSEGANDDEDDGFDVAQPGLGIEDELVEQETEARLADALPEAMDKLSPQQRKAVELCDVDDRSREDAAASMGVATGTVNAHRARGMQKLRAVLEPIMRIALAMVGAVTTAVTGTAIFDRLDDQGRVLVLVTVLVLAVAINVVLRAGRPRGPRGRGRPRIGK